MIDIISTDDFLKRKNIDESSFQLVELDSTPDAENHPDIQNNGKAEAIVPASHSTITLDEATDKFLKQKGIAINTAVVAMSDAEARAYELRHRLGARTTILWTLILPMAIVPFWLMIQLSLPIFGIKPYSEKMQLGLLAALATDVVGLFYVVTRDLYPNGGGTSRRRLSTSNDNEGNRSD